MIACNDVSIASFLFYLDSSVVDAVFAGLTESIDILHNFVRKT